MEPVPASVTPLPTTPDLLVALEQAGVAAARGEQVADLIDIAASLDGRAGLGSLVTVADRAGRVTEYELIARSGDQDARQRVTIASATGRALLGARVGAYVHVTLANGRRRRVRVIDVGPVPTEKA
jgi:transcription elongation GreA/GreB family factor